MNRALPRPNGGSVAAGSHFFQSLFSVKAQTVFAAARALKSSVYFALDLIAAKPVKLCDGGVFRALNSLLISERASSESGRFPPSLKPAKTTPENHHLSSLGLIRSCLRNEPGFAASQWQCGCRKPCFSKPVQHEGANRFCRRPSPEKRRLFRSCFDSSKARQTVRWRRFRGLEFAPDFKAASGWTERARPKPCAARVFGSVRFAPGW